jgi:hypothetical protein
MESGDVFYVVTVPYADYPGSGSMGLCTMQVSA